MDILLPSPTPKQKEFLLADKPYVEFGGARGGGKSFAVRLKAKILALKRPGIRMLLLRRTYPELRENHIRTMTAETVGWAKYKDTDKTLTFFNGSLLKFGYCQAEKDADQYQGQEYDVIFFDEGTHFTEDMFTRICACNRGANEYPKRIYVTCNPGGPGMAWVKRLFISRDYRPGENSDDYMFLASSVYDNKPLLDKDPAYLGRLLALPDDLRKAWLDGDWDVFAGQFFPEFRRGAHVCAPFEIPEHWTRVISMDYGLDMLAVLWGAFDESGHGVIYKELCAEGLNVSAAARAILDRCDAAETERDGKVRVVAPPDLWARSKDTGRTIEEIFRDNGVLLDRVDSNRQNGWINLKDWLTIKDGDLLGVPGIRFFDSCSEIVKCLPLLQYSRRSSLDCDTEPHDITHAPDSLRYMLMSRPKRASAPDSLSAEDRMLAEHKRRAIGANKKRL